MPCANLWIKMAERGTDEKGMVGRGTRAKKICTFWPEMAAYIIKSWRWKLICLCAWNVNAAHTYTYTHTDTFFCCCRTGCCACRYARVCVCLWHVSDICLKVFWQALLDIHWKHRPHTHSVTHSHISHAHPTYHTHHSHTHRHTQPCREATAASIVGAVFLICF